MKKDIPLSETIERVVRASADDRRDWLSSAPVCTALAPYAIVHVGSAEVVHPYSVKRPDLSGTFAMFCTAGEGRLWLEGQWQPMRSGMACLAPPHSMHAYRTVPHKNWSLAWVRYQEAEGMLPLVNARAPVLSKFDGGPLTAAVEGLYREAKGTASPAVMHLWVNLIEHYVRTFAEPWRTDDRLQGVWQAVTGDPSARWPLSRLASLAGMTTKHFRRLCLQSYGRTPSRQVTALRMQCAMRLLTSGREKVETIAYQVGYRSLFTFSHVFKNFTGYRPSEYREKS
jgi:AraC-like DNA-binding protein